MILQSKGCHKHLTHPAAGTSANMQKGNTWYRAGEAAMPKQDCCAEKMLHASSMMLETRWGWVEKRVRKKTGRGEGGLRGGEGRGEKSTCTRWCHLAMSLASI